MTIRLIDFDQCPLANRYYGGNAGRKTSIVWNDDVWMVKFPENTAGMRGNIRSYTTSPLSEWLGSHVYDLLGIPVHETVLGLMQGKVVVACRDFTQPGYRFVDFHDIKNAYQPRNEILPDGTASSGLSTFLSDVLETIAAERTLRRTPGVADRFWDMFVVDALIGNTDRNNSNWGIFIYEDGRSELAPVFDNGNAFFNKRRHERIEADLDDVAALRGLAISGVESIYRADNGKRIRPFEYLLSGVDPGCNAAVLRVASRLDLARLHELVDSIPASVRGVDLMPPAVAEFHKDILTRRVNDGILEAARRLGGLA